uniref:Uncharacterized protein n=1 Tax=Oryza rufipogon TaxID=4529 RepID=A0A0E0NEK6_ORYRU
MKGRRGRPFFFITSRAPQALSLSSSRPAAAIVGRSPSPELHKTNPCTTSFTSLRRIHFTHLPLLSHLKSSHYHHSSCCRGQDLAAAVPAILLSPYAFLHLPRVRVSREHHRPPTSPILGHRSTDALLPPSPLYSAGRRREEEEDEKKRLKEHLTVGPTFIKSEGSEVYNNDEFI